MFKIKRKEERNLLFHCGARPARFGATPGRGGAEMLLGFGAFVAKEAGSSTKADARVETWLERAFLVGLLALVLLLLGPVFA